MNPIQHASNNDVLKPPTGVSNDVCRPLPITRIWYADPSGDTSQDTPGVVCYFLPTAEQLALLNQGKPVFLSFLGFNFPPVAVGVEGDGRL